METAWRYLTWRQRIHSSNKMASQVLLKQLKINIYGLYFSNWRAFWRCIFLLTKCVFLLTMFFLCLMIIGILGTLSPNLTIWKWMQHAKLISVWNLDTPCQLHFINKYEGRHSLSTYLRNVHLSGSSASSDTCPRHFSWGLMSPWVLLTKFLSAEWTCARSFPAVPAPSVLSAWTCWGLW